MRATSVVPCAAGVETPILGHYGRWRHVCRSDQHGHSRECHWDRKCFHEHRHELVPGPTNQPLPNSMRSHFLQRLAIEPATCKPVSCGCADQGKSEDPEAVGQIGSSAWMVCLGTR